MIGAKHKARGNAVSARTELVPRAQIFNTASEKVGKYVDVKSCALSASILFLLPRKYWRKVRLGVRALNKTKEKFDDLG